MKTSIFYMLIMGVVLGGISSTHNQTLLQHRWQFKEAHQALLKKDLNSFEQLSAQLQDYQIAHYLRYFYLESHIEEENAETIQKFLAKYKDSPIAQSLRQVWLTHLANKHLLGEQLDKAKDLWLVGISQPNECDPVFVYLYDKKIITNQMRWQRIRLSMQKGNLGLARFIAKSLPKADQQLAELWQALHTKPATALNKFDVSDTPTEKSREMLLHGLRRLARKNADRAHRHWTLKKKHYAFTVQENAELFHYIALRSAKQNHPKAAHWLAEVDKDLVDEPIIQARLQIALAQQDWQAVTKLIQSLPVAERDQLQLQYWHARALEQTGEYEKAKKLYQALSQNRDYYGFLAAARIGKPYNFQSHPLNITKEQKNQLLEKQAGLLRARELYFVGLTSEAAVEWQAVLPSLTPEELKTAAAIAHQWGWHYRAIVTIAKVKYYDDLDIRFPLPFYDAVLTHADVQQLDFAYVYAVIRQESAFKTEIGSSAGAQGLMQLMPATAKQVAKQQHTSLKTIEELWVPDINIGLGTAYLRSLLNQFNGNRLLATAAYNAGPSRAKQWAKKYGCLPPDIWIELIPFNETRKYVQRVLSYIPVFEYQMVGHPQIKQMPVDAILAKGCSNNP
jgi:soluble lytic murein transglycosylase